jgi:hypothetical protein
VNGVAELENIAQEVGAMAEAFQDAGKLLASGLETPLVVHSGYVAGCVGVFNDLDLRF